ncbi:MAG TPA: ABC transporter permease [Lachnospiraceae bacterium]|nr:ABC transporter permease [Lachnospiraceae bacterium]
MNSWEIEIVPKTRMLDFKFKELWEYRQLIWTFVKRNYSTRYKQMVFGSAWLIISPLLSVLFHTIIFGGIAGLSTDGIPRPLFYLASNILWAFFANTVHGNSGTFTGNAGLFGKIYFPRIIVPISNLITSALDFFIQFVLLVCLMFGYHFWADYELAMNWTIAFIPVYLLQLGILGVGIGILISSLTTKYRDLIPLVGYGISLWMYLSPVVYSIDLIPKKFQGIYMLNPTAPVLLGFKYSIFGIGSIMVHYMLISLAVSLVIFFIGLLLFNQIEKTFMDTV